MQDQTCILTARDLAILEAMRARRLGYEDPMARLIDRKITGARIVFGEDVPADVATLDSRVLYRVGDGEPDTRVITSEATRSPVGLFLPVASPRGLALLGLSEGEAFDLAGSAGDETIRLEKVLYQPEAARREKRALAAGASPEARRRGLRIIDGAYADRPRSSGGGVDDPGPSAA
jgi:regulator of nucleoside diphosphate kinase